MNRRDYLGVVGTAGLGTVAGCIGVERQRTLSDPTVHASSPERRSSEWFSDGASVGELGVTGSLDTGGVDLTTEISHRKETLVESSELRLWMPERPDEENVRTAVVSPVEGAETASPSILMYPADEDPGTVVEFTNFGELKDETIGTIRLVVRPPEFPVTTLNLDTKMRLTGRRLLGDDYTLDGRLQLRLRESANG